MSFEIRISDTFRRAAKTLTKKYPSLKQDISDLAAELTSTPAKVEANQVAHVVLLA